MPYAAITTTPAGLRCLIPICQTLDAQLWLPSTLADAPSNLSYETYSGSLREFLAAHWANYDGFIFCLASGAVVRLIAPLLTDKATDPAVIVIDEGGQFAISLCGGHQGGADRLAQQVSHCLDSQPVLTGAANRLDLAGIDVLGRPFGWTKGSGDWTGVSAAIARSASVQILQDCGTDLWQSHLPPGHPYQFGSPEFADCRDQPPPQARIWISPIQRQFSPDSDFPPNLPKVQWHPRVLWVGIGCERGTPEALIELAIETVFRENHLALGAIAGIASLDLKADEPGLLSLCQKHRWPLRTFTAAQL
ncbi:cobalamin biosynthesis protein, partial [Romeria aff. gracilis LEGE 07310]